MKSLILCSMLAATICSPSGFSTSFSEHTGKFSTMSASPATSKTSSFSQSSLSVYATTSFSRPITATTHTLGSTRLPTMHAAPAPTAPVVPSSGTRFAQQMIVQRTKTPFFLAAPKPPSVQLTALADNPAISVTITSDGDIDPIFKECLLQQRIRITRDNLQNLSKILKPEFTLGLHEECIPDIGQKRIFVDIVKNDDDNVLLDPVETSHLKPTDEIRMTLDKVLDLQNKINYGDKIKVEVKKCFNSSTSTIVNHVAEVQFKPAFR